MTTYLLETLIRKLVGVRAFIRAEIKDANRHPVPVFRADLEGFLRITQGELMEAFGVNSPSKVSLTLRKAIAVVARIHKGRDSYRTVAEKAEVLIKRLHPLYVAALERGRLDALEKRNALITRVTSLMDEVNEPGLRHPDVSGINDTNLLVLERVLADRHAVVMPVRTPLRQKLLRAVT